MARLAFLSHAAERTGPPIVLLHLARWLRANTDHELELVFLQGGELESTFRELGRVTILDEWAPPRAAVLIESVAWKVRLGRWAPAVRHVALRRRLRRVTDLDLVYVNTAGSVRALRHLPDGDPVVVTHVHELSVGLDHHLPAEDHELIRRRTHHYLAVAEVVARATEASFGVDDVAVAAGFVDTTRANGDQSAATVRRRVAGIPLDALVVGAAGLTHWRKAPDLFVQVARLVAEQYDGERPLHFLWVGGEADGPELAPVLHDVTRAGLEGRVTFVGHQADPQPWLRTFDVLLLPAREDAFPLVCLEAAAEGVPIVCFDNGGMPELVDAADAGAVVSYPDLRAMAAAVLGLLVDEPRRREQGANADAWVRAHHDVAVGAARIHEELARWL